MTPEPDSTERETRNVMRSQVPRTGGMEHFASVELVLTEDPSTDFTSVRLELIADKTVTLVSVVYLFYRTRR